MKIVIADDSPLLRERIKSLIGNVINIEVVGEAQNGFEALSLLNEKKPDLILLDIRMPFLNGINTLRQIRAGGNPVKVCILTNYPYKQYRQRCMTEGADYFFDKDQDIEQLKELLSCLSKAT